MIYRIAILLYIFTLFKPFSGRSQPTHWEIIRFKFKLPSDVGYGNNSTLNIISLDTVYSNQRTYNGRITRDSCYVEIYIIEDIQLLSKSSIKDTSVTKGITLILNVNSIKYKFLLHNLPNKESLTYIYLGEIENKYRFYEYFISKKCCSKETLLVNDRTTEIYNLTKYRKKRKSF